MCWILDESAPNEVKQTVDISEECKEMEKTSVKEDTTVTTRNVSDESVQKAISEKIQSQKEEEEQKANRSAHTLIDINFKIKKGTPFKD